MAQTSIKDVAQRAGVSLGTVSNVLNRPQSVSAPTRRRVLAAIKELGYVRNDSARHLRAGQSRTVAIVVLDVSNPFFTDVVRGAEKAAARGLRGQTYTIGVMLPNIRNPFFPEILDGLTDWLHDTDYQVLLGPGCNGEEAERRVTEAMIDRGMDGLILIAPISPRPRLEHIAGLAPTVVIGRHGHSATYDTVVDDDFAGAGLIVSHLAELGHRRIAHIEHRETDPVRLTEMPNAIRANGYRHAMQSNGLAGEIDVVSTSYTQEGGYIGAKQLLAEDPRPTAIFAGADIVAMGVLDAIAEAGLSVPGDISVAGYDNTTFAAFGHISLTSVDQAGQQIGANAARLLLDRIADRDAPSAHVKFSPTLVVRRTTAAPPHTR